MTWSDLGYGMSLTIVVGSVLAFLLAWREGHAGRAAEMERRRLDARTVRGHRVHAADHIDRAA